MFSGKCHLSSFVDPHLFGIFSIKNTEKLRKLETVLDEHMNKCTEKVNPQIGKIFIIKDSDGIYKRGIIESVQGNGAVCWLMDYGKLYDTNIFYKIPIGFDAKSPALAFKAGLINVVALSHNYEEGYIPSLKWTSGACHATEQYIKAAEEIVFCEEEKINNVCYGQIILTKDETPFNLVSKLIQENVVATDPNMFRQAIQNVNREIEDIPKKTFVNPMILEHNIGIGRGSRILQSQKERVIDNESRVKLVESWLKTSDLSILSPESNSRSQSVVDSDDSVCNISTDAEGEKNESGGDKVHLRALRKCILDMHQSANNTDKSPTLKNISDSADNSPTSCTTITKNGTFVESKRFAALRARTSKMQQHQENVPTCEVLESENNPEIPEEAEAENGNKWECYKSDNVGDMKLLPAGSNLPSPTLPKNKDRVSPGVSPVFQNKDRVSPVFQNNDRASPVFQKPKTRKDYSDGEIPTFASNNVNTFHTLGCHCANCKEWNVKDFDSPKIEFQKKKKVADDTIKPAPLFKTAEDIGRSVETMASYTNNLSKSSKAVTPKLLVHGSMIPHPVGKIADLPYIKCVHDALKTLNYKTCKTIQTYASPCLMRNMNVCMVNSSKTGKTMAYIPAICSFLLQQSDRYSSLPKGNSPIAIIVCPGAQRGEEVAWQFNALMKKVISKSRIHAAEAFPPILKQLIVQIETRCDILIATPTTLLGLLSKNTITLKRLCHLVVEDFDKILNKQTQEINTILRVTQEMLIHRTCFNQVQFVCTAEHWTKPLENVMKDLSSLPVICIGSHLQSAFYGRADIQMSELKKEFKLDRLAEILKDMYNVYKTIVVCKSEEISAIVEHLQLYSISLVVAENTMSIEDLDEVELTWQNRTNGEHIVLLCTDDVLNTNFTISNASLLVNYSIPDTWTGFVKRFASLLDSYKSPLTTTDEPYNCKIYIFVDQSCEVQFPRLADMFTEMGAKLPKHFIDCAGIISRNVEESKIVTREKLCKSIKLFGTCSRKRCTNRHLLSSKIDTNKRLPQSGKIKYQILNVIHVNRFIIKPLEYTDDEGIIHIVEDKTDYIVNCMKTKLLEFATHVDIGHSYIYKHHTVESRCIVKSIRSTDSITRSASEVEIYEIDLGTTKFVPTTDLFVLPDEIKNIPAIGIEIFIINIIPQNKDTYWTQCAKKVMVDSLEAHDYKEEDVYCISNIILQLGRGFLVDDIRIQEYLPSMKTTINKYLLKKTLVNKKIVEYSTAPLENLRELCKECGIQMPNIIADTARQESFNIKQAKPQWAHLDCYYYNEVYFVNGIPSLFYVRLVKFQKLLEDFQKYLKHEIFKPMYLSLKEENIIVGNHYLAQDPNGEDYYCRVVVKKIVDDLADCFYVDYGDWKLQKKSELKYLRDDMITKIPFQAIECRMYGVYPKEANDLWDEEAIDLMYTYSTEPESDIFRRLYTSTIKLGEAQNTGTYRYTVLLLDYCQNKPKLINKLLLECGYGAVVKHESLDVDFQLPKQMNLQDSDETDEDDIDDKEYTLTELQQMKDACVEDSDSYSVISHTEETFDDGDGVWDFEIIDPEQFLKDLAEVKEKPKLAIAESTPIKPKKLKKTAAAKTVAEFSTPNVMWHQTDRHVKLEIKLTDLKDYEVKVVLGRAFNFSAYHDDKTYKLTLQLYESVNKKFTHIATGQVLRINLTKTKEIDWPRLTMSSELMKHIKFNTDMLVVPDENPKRKLLYIGEDKVEESADLDSVMVHESGSDFDSSSDIMDSDDSS